MHAVQVLIWRELRRFFCQPLGYVLCLAFFAIQAYLFQIVVHLLSTPQPQSLSPLTYIFSDAVVLHLYGFFIPALAMRCFAEERALGTWESMSCLGITRGQIVVAKFLSHGLLLAFLQGLTLVFVLSLTPFIEIDAGTVISGYMGLLGVGGLWLAASLFASCRIRSMVLAYLMGFTIIFVLRSIPFFSAIFSDSLYRPLFDTFNMELILNKSSQGFVDLYDMLFLLLSTGALLVFCCQALGRERHAGHFRPGAVGAEVLWKVGLLLGIYLCLYIAQHRPLRLDLAQRDRLSPEFQKVLRQAPAGATLTLILPSEAKLENFIQARDLIVDFSRAVVASRPDYHLEILDPDIDLLEIERLRKEHELPQNAIGGILLHVGERSVSIPYHQLIYQSTANVKGMPEKYIRSFHGERQLASAFNALMRTGADPRVLIIEGQRELKLRSDVREGGSKFLEMLDQWRFDLKSVNPVEHEIQNLEDYKLALWLDPVDEPGPAHRELIRKLLEKRVPLFVCRSYHAVPPAGGRPWTALGDYGLKFMGRVVVQKAYPSTHPLLLPIHDYAGHPLGNDLENSACFFYGADVLELGVAADPRLRSRVLGQTAGHPDIRGLKNFDASQPEGPVGVKDVWPSPLITAATVELETPEGHIPLLVALSSRGLLENRFIDEGANRQLLFKSLEWLMEGGENLLLPPTQPRDYSLQMKEGQRRMFDVVTMGLVPLLLLMSGGMVWWRRR